MRDQATIIIRSSGERTYGVLKSYLLNLSSQEHVNSVEHIRPFSEALRVSLELGIKKNRQWTLMLDADVLPSTQGIERLLQYTQNFDTSYFEFQSKILDLTFGGERGAGVHLYRTEYIPKALQYIPKPEDSTRPETTMIKKMAEVGHKYSYLDDVLGLHDFEQYYKDLFRKGFFHARKHNSHITLLRKFWLRESQHNTDYKALLWGVEAFEHYQGEVVADSTILMEDYFHDQMSKYNLKEKESFEVEDLDAYVTGTIKQHTVPPEFHEIQRKRNQQHSIFRRIKNYLQI